MTPNDAHGFSTHLGRVTADDLNASFRGEVYGDSPAMNEDWFHDHVARNDIDLARSPRWTVEGELAGAALLALRGDRAWIGAFGIVPRFRRRGLASRYLEEVLALARESGATSVELEVLENNPDAIRLYERGGFEQIDQLVAWSRAPLEDASPPLAGGDVSASFDAQAVAAIMRVPATCWQREPPSVAAAAPFQTIILGETASPDAYAFVRHRPERSSLLDAGARDAAAAGALLRALDVHLPERTLFFLNEPARGPLHDAFVADGRWSEFARQRRMRILLPRAIAAARFRHGSDSTLWRIGSSVR